jgi:hypothetical protein
MIIIYKVKGETRLKVKVEDGKVKGKGRILII